MIFFPFYWSHYNIYYTPCTFKWTHIFLARSLNASLVPETLWKEVKKWNTIKAEVWKIRTRTLKMWDPVKPGLLKTWSLKQDFYHHHKQRYDNTLKQQTFEIVIPKYNARKSYTVYLFKRLTFVHVLPELQKKLK